MAITKTIEIKVKAKEAIKDFGKLDDSIVDTKNDIINLERQLIKLEKQLAKTNARDSKGRLKLNNIIDKTKQSIKEEKNALKSLTLQKSITDKATRLQTRSNKNLNQSYFDSKEALTDVNRLTAEFALKVKAVKNVFLGAIDSIKKFAKAQKLAFAASVIGVALIALIAIVSQWKKISDFVSGVTKKLEKQREKLKAIQKTNKLLIDQKTAEIKLAEKLGLATEDLVKEKIILIKIQQTINDQLITTLEREALILKSETLKITLREKFLRLVMNAANPNSGDAFLLKQQLEASEKFKEFQDLIVESKTKQIELASLLFDIENPDKETLKKEAQKRDIAPAILGDVKIDDDPEVSLELAKNVRIAELREARRITNRAISELEAQDNIDAAEAERNRIETLQQFKIDIENNTLDLIFNIAKRGSAVAKAVAIQDIVKDQVKSISQTISAITVANAKAAAASPLTLGQPFVTLNTIAGITGMAASAAGAARAIKDILSEKKSVSGGGGGLGGGSAPAAPSFNLVAGSGTNQIAEGLANQPTPIRAFVVSSEVTNAQSLDRNIQDEGSI